MFGWGEGGRAGVEPVVRLGWSGNELLRWLGEVARSTREHSHYAELCNVMPSELPALRNYLNILDVRAEASVTQLQIFVWRIVCTTRKSGFLSNNISQ
jgi:hypothetical protein